MKETLQTIQTLLHDIKGDLNLLRLTSVYNKLERVTQLFESVVRELKEKEDATK